MTFNAFTIDLFLFTFDLKHPNKLRLKCTLYRNFNSCNFRNGVAVRGHADISSVNDGAMVRKVLLTED